jgi:hypothetical protein
MYALFKDGKQISKSHAHRLCAIIEAYERGAVVTKLGLLTSYAIGETGRYADL